MEAALKEVYNVHRNVVRGTRKQLHQAESERDKMKQKFTQYHNQLGSVVSSMMAQLGNLRSDLSELKNLENRLQSLDAQSLARAIRLVSSLIENESTQLIMQVSSLDEMLQSGSHLLTGPDDGKETSQEIGDVSSATAEKEETQGADHNHRTLTATSMAQNVSQKQGNQQRLPTKDNTRDADAAKLDTLRPLENTLSENTKNSKNLHVQNFTNMQKGRAQKSNQGREVCDVKNPNQDESNLSLVAGNGQIQAADQDYRKNRTTMVSSLQNLLKKKKDSQSPQAENSHKLQAVDPSEHAENLFPENVENVDDLHCQNSPNVNHRDLLTEDTERKKSAEKGAPQKSPEPGVKLQLTRNARKRRRYIEDDKLRKRLKLLTKGSVVSKNGDSSNSDGELPSNHNDNPPTDPVTPSTKPSQSAERLHRGSGTGRITAHGETEAVPMTRPQTSSHRDVETAQGILTSPGCDRDKDRRRASDREDAVILVPDTLGVDLSVTEADEEEDVQNIISLALHKNKEPTDILSRKQKTTLSSSSTHSRSSSSSSKRNVSGGGGSDKNSEKNESGKGKVTSERKCGPSAWPTDSVVFGSAGPTLPRGNKQEAVTSSSVYIDEGQQSADCLSPVFLTDIKDLQHGDMSPTLFDNADSGDDSMETSPAAMVFSDFDRPAEQSQVKAVSPVSPMLLQAVQTRCKGVSATVDNSASDSERGTSLRGVQGKRKVSSCDNSLSVKEHSNKQPHRLENPSLQSDTDLTAQPNTTQIAAWTPAARKNLFKSKTAESPSPDDTINPCLLLESTIGESDGSKRNGGEERQPPVHSQLNASLDPAVRLTQYLAEQTPEVEGEEEGDVTLDPRFQRMHQMSGQDVTMMSLSSTDTNTDVSHSVTVVSQTEAGRLPAGVALLEDSFDRVPQKQAQTTYAYREVVRKQSERRKLKGFSCQDCQKYYDALGRAEEGKKRMGECSRHRGRQAMPNTPEHFWSIGFPDTEECEERSKRSSARNRR